MPETPQKIEHCVIHCRVSHPKQTQGVSLEEQEIIGRGVASRKGWNVLKVFSYPYSGRKEDRRDFDEVIEYIKKSKTKVSHYVFKGFDRFTRCGVPAYLKLKARLEKLGVTVVDSYGLIQPKMNTLEYLGFSYDWSLFSPSEAAELLEAHRSKEDVRDILTRLISAEIRLAKDGYNVRQPAVGFINQTVLDEGKKRTIQVPDPDRAHFLIEMFELRAKQLPDPLIVERLNAMGYRSRYQHRWSKDHTRIIGRSGGNPLTIKQLQRIVQRPIYAGVNAEKWTNYQPVRAKYDGLVSVDLFNKANKGKIFIEDGDDGSLQLLHDYSPFGKVQKKRLHYNPLYPFKFLLCPHCRKPFLGSASRGKGGAPYAGYHCGGYKSGPRAHPYYRISKEEFDGAVERFVKALRYTPKFFETLHVELLVKYRREEQRLVSRAAKMNRAVADIKADQADALRAFEAATSTLTRAMLEEKIERLEKQAKSAQKQRKKIEISEDNINTFVQYVKFVMEHPAEVLLDRENLASQRALFGLIFEETPTYEEILNGTPKLALVFELSSDFVKGKSLLVTLQSLRWKTVEQMVLEWLSVFDTFSVIETTTVSSASS